MVDPFVIGGLVISSLQLASQWRRDVKDALAWQEEDLPVDSRYVGVAVEMGVLEGPVDRYCFMRIEKIPTAELENTHEVLFAVNKEKRIKYRLVRGLGTQTPVALVSKVSA